MRLLIFRGRPVLRDRKGRQDHREKLDRPDPKGRRVHKDQQAQVPALLASLRVPIYQTAAPPSAT